MDWFKANNLKPYKQAANTDVFGKVYFDVKGAETVQKKVRKAAIIPAKDLTYVTKTAANMIRKAAKAGMTKDTGLMKRGFKLHAEKRKVGKKVYRIGFWGMEGDGEEFVKYSKSGERSFYPVSQEYGWITQNGKKKEGTHAIRNAIRATRGMAEQFMSKTLAEYIERLARK